MKENKITYPLRKVIIICVSLCMLVGFTGCRGNAIVPKKATEDVRPYITQIILIVDNQKIATLGTALLINADGYAVTAAHILAIGEQQLSQIQSENKKMAIMVPTPQGAPGAAPEPLTLPVNNFQILERDEYDLALLRIEMTQVINPLNGEISPSLKYINGVSGTLNIEPLKLASGYPKPGDAIAISVYPDQSLRLVTERGVINTGVGEIPKIRVFSANGQFIEQKLAYHYTTDVKAKGLSGAPAYLRNNTIIGLAVETGGEIGDTRETLLLPVSYLRELVDRWGVAHR